MSVSPQIHKCEVCGSKVRIIGTGTMHYEPVITLEEILGGLPKKKKLDMQRSCEERRYPIGYNSALEDCEQAIRGMFK